MSGILSLLPLLRGWRYDLKDISVPELITSKKEIFKTTDEKGWFLWATGVMNNKNASIRVLVDGYYEATGSPYRIYSAGITVPSSFGLWTGVYSDLLTAYSLLFTPPYPWWYTKSIVIELTPPAGETVILASYGHLLVRIDDNKEFIKSIKEVLT